MAPQVGGKAFGQRRTFTRPDFQPPELPPPTASRRAIENPVQSPGKFIDFNAPTQIDPRLPAAPRQMPPQQFTSVGEPRYQGRTFAPSQNPLGGFTDVGSPRPQQTPFTRIGAPNYQPAAPVPPVFQSPFAPPTAMPGGQRIVPPRSDAANPITNQDTRFGRDGVAGPTLGNDDHIARPRSPVQTLLNIVGQQSGPSVKTLLNIPNQQSGLSVLPVQQQAQPDSSAYNPNRQPPAGLSPYAMEQWNSSRQEAARMNPVRAEGNPVSSSAYNPNRQPPAGLSPSAMEQWNSSRAQVGQDAAFWAAAERERAAYNAANPPAPGSAVAQNLAQLEQNVQREMQSRGIAPQGNPMQSYAVQSRGSAAGPQYDPQAQAAYEGPTGNPMRQGAMPGSSNQAGLRAGNIPYNGGPVSPEMQHGAIAEANGYNGNVAAINDPNRMTPAQKYAAAQQGAQQMGQYDPTNMSGRFGSGSNLGAQAAAIQQGQAGVADKTHYRIPGSYGETATYNPMRPSPEVQYRSNKNGDQRSYIPPGADQVLNRQNAALHRQVANPERGASRKARREAESARRADVKFKHQVSQGMNPMSPKAQAMFPAQVAAMKGMQNPLAGPGQIAGTPFENKAPKTADNRKKSADMKQKMMEGGVTPDGRQIPPAPIWAAVGATPDSSMKDIHFGVYEHMNSGVDLSPDDLQSLHQFAVLEKQNAVDGNDPFKISNWYSLAEGWGEKSAKAHDKVYGPLWRELSEMPIGTDPAKLKDWEKRFREGQAKVRGDSAVPAGTADTPRLTGTDMDNPLPPEQGGFVSGAGNILDLPGSSVRDILAGENPFDQWIHPLSGRGRATGSQISSKWGM